MQGSGSVNSTAERELSPITQRGEYEASDDPFTSSVGWGDHGLTEIAPLLVPFVCVTPETRVIDMGYHNFWVAVEITASLHRPSDERMNPFESITPRSQQSQKSRCTVELGE